jgi:hypothetical protein
LFNGGLIIKRQDEEESVMPHFIRPLGGSPISVLCLFRCLSWRRSKCRNLSHLIFPHLILPEFSPFFMVTSKVISSGFRGGCYSLFERRQEEWTYFFCRETKSSHRG